MPSLGMGEDNMGRYGSIVTSVLYMSGIAVAWRRRKLFLFASIVGAIALVVRWVSLQETPEHWTAGTGISTLVICALISWILLTEIFQRRGPITLVSIQAAIAVYLLFGLSWANCYLMVMKFNPNAFQSTVALSSASATEWYYYSYVTLTTLGYGEITPVSQVARVLSVAEALTGQLYLAVLVARLIARELISSRQTLSDEEK